MTEDTPVSGTGTTRVRDSGERPRQPVVSLHPILTEDILEAGDVCQNCHRRIRSRRVHRRSRDPASPTSVRRSKYRRRRRSTVVDYGPGDTADESRGVWCHCGAEDAWTRLWETAHWERVRELIKATIRTLESKGYTVDRDAFALVALARCGTAPIGPNGIAAALSASIAAGVDESHPIDT